MAVFCKEVAIDSDGRDCAISIFNALRIEAPLPRTVEHWLMIVIECNPGAQVSLRYLTPRGGHAGHVTAKEPGRDGPFLRIVERSGVLIRQEGWHSLEIRVNAKVIDQVPLHVTVQTEESSSPLAVQKRPTH